MRWRNRVKYPILLLGLRYHTLGHPLRVSLRWALENYDKYLDYMVFQDSYRPSPLSEKRAEKELIFQGFKKLENYAVDAEFSYIKTNKPINGSIYIYPMKLGHGYYQVKAGYPEIYHWDGVYCPGHLKMQLGKQNGIKGKISRRTKV